MKDEENKVSFTTFTRCTLIEKHDDDSYAENITWKYTELKHDETAPYLHSCFVGNTRTLKPFHIF